jgi:hypothetical protein
MFHYSQRTSLRICILRISLSLRMLPHPEGLIKLSLLESLTQSISQSASLGMSLSESLSQSVSYSLSHRVSHSECFTQSLHLSSASLLRVSLSECHSQSATLRASRTRSLSESLIPSISLTESLTYIVSHPESLTPWCSLKETSCFQNLHWSMSLKHRPCPQPGPDHRRPITVAVPPIGSSMTVVALPRRTPSGDRDRTSTTVVVSVNRTPK